MPRIKSCFPRKIRSDEPWWSGMYTGENMRVAFQHSDPSFWPNAQDGDSWETHLSTMSDKLSLTAKIYLDKWATYPLTKNKNVQQTSDSTALKMHNCSNTGRRWTRRKITTFDFTWACGEWIEAKITAVNWLGVTLKNCPISADIFTEGANGL